VSAFGIYVHWPFCVSKCPYCDFNSHVAEAVDHDRWRAGFKRELEYYAGLTPGRTVTSIFFGGGTPSLMQPQTVAMVIDRIAALWPVASDVEITAEANPGSVDMDVFSGFAAAGVNRVSIGVQSFDADALRFLGRKHDAGEARRAIDLAAKTFPRFSFDLIYARPGHTVAAWAAELEDALSYQPSHLSAYQLTIEDGTKFAGLHAQGAFILPGQEQAADLYEATNAQLAAAGLNAYEISNYAKPGHESRHNLTYWRYQDYIGIGPGAHGRLTLNSPLPAGEDAALMRSISEAGEGLSRIPLTGFPKPFGLSETTSPAGRGNNKFATRAHRAPEKWLALVAANGHGAHAPEPVSYAQRFEELMMMGLRLAEPIPFTRIESETGRGLYDWVPRASIEKLVHEGLLTISDDRVATTAAGRQRLNSILQYLIARVKAA
jgi:oxygen-independent coproporphyrinogen-3 oxidase